MWFSRRLPRSSRIAALISRSLTFRRYSLCAVRYTCSRPGKRASTTSLLLFPPHIPHKPTSPLRLHGAFGEAVKAWPSADNQGGQRERRDQGEQRTSTRQTDVVSDLDQLVTTQSSQEFLIVTDLEGGQFRSFQLAVFWQWPTLTAMQAAPLWLDVSCAHLTRVRRGQYCHSGRRT